MQEVKELRAFESLGLMVLGPGFKAALAALN